MDDATVDAVDAPATGTNTSTGSSTGASLEPVRDHGRAHAFEMPRIRALLLHAAPRVLEGVIAPVAVFYAAFALLGLSGGMVAAVVWVYGGIVYRRLRGHPVTATLLLAAVGVTVRAVLGVATHSAVVYFLQPTLGTMLMAMVFLASVPLGRPLAQKLATEMVPMPEAFLKHRRVRRFFLRISLLWAFVLFANALISLWMLFHQSVGTYVWARSGLVIGIGAVGAAVSVWWFRRLLRHVNPRPTAA
ncbi:VC0807 family protein [Actinomadura atramentaria]|uniref:VC0807 family protein n=1 Tax=Actinomadura atramentaria TaxID=1990 RepID=UPI00035E2026|nr:VC0807 family protein [Actinomadura atramentaria]